MERKDIAYSGLAIVASLFFVFFLVRIESSPILYENNEPLIVGNVVKLPTILIGESAVYVEVASKPEEIEKGLSRRTGLPADHGMLFEMGKPDKYRFWMKNMRFPLDIVWIEGGKVVSIDRNVQNDFDTAGAKFYSPSSPASYVLEVNAGFTDSHGINDGDAVDFTHIEI
ncbi:MAG: hypothetical protein COV07_02210 [Candidatus Vogelbacteria bacterium CG10_big_fil_rev_8_21_14_0_10_45_14]|uniref:DUF192 domain-containing protein n=1 Tax=Candidatus Vogelbacteria bacterium CG10_big_fil_rev_8_21_14_0_10_45_14 TaxID=1975042 RepID=A0A2H0RM47_9BACT|nr:MAG: hypothetical protein COV07_02210 [Candidatus Vogelbacteria bacterium CG10_big_fil_rev_8_21_14_0_10_45_14]